MAKLTAKARRKLPSSSFGLPGKRKYPIENKSHARAAKGRATQQYRKGNLSAAQRSKINSRANRVLRGR